MLIGNMKIITCFMFVTFILFVDGANIYGTPGEKTQITCGVPTTNRDVAWSFDGHLLIKINGKSGRTVKGSSHGVSSNRIRIKGDNLVFTHLLWEDIGVYTCRVNEKNIQHRLYFLTVSPSPTFKEGGLGTLSCQVEGSEPLPEVTWLTPKGKPERPGKVELNPVALSDAGDWHCQCSLDGDVHKVKLQVKVEAFQVTPPSIPTTNPERGDDPNPENVNNSKGASPVSVKTKAMLFLGFKLWVWVVVGAGCLIMVLLVVSTIVTLQRKRRTRRAKRFTPRRPLKPSDYCQCHCRPPATAPPLEKKLKPPALRVQQC